MQPLNVLPDIHRRDPDLPDWSFGSRVFPTAESEPSSNHSTALVLRPRDDLVGDHNGCSKL
jgi:hypothetical protein